MSAPDRKRLLRAATLLLSAVALPLWGAAAGAGFSATPFAPRSSTPAAKLFSPVPAATSGVTTTNRYDDPRMWGERYEAFEVGAVGTGVAIGDYDSDGRADIFVVSKTESCRLCRNLGDWKFADVTEQAGVADRGSAAAEWKQGASFADVNNDGRLDLYVCRLGAPNLLYLNQGDGTFKEEAAARGLAVVDASVMGCFCDYDRDGWLDLFVLTNMLDPSASPTGQPAYLFHNNRDGTFTNVTDKSGVRCSGQGHSATWWDYNEDGWPDLYVAYDFAGPDFLYRNNGDGTFTNVIDAAVPHTTLSSMGADLADVNNDGRIDLLVADMAATTHQKDQRTMAQMRSLALDPIDGAAPTAPQYPHNALFLATGVGRCLEAARLAGLDATDWTWAPRFEDLDEDGRVDLFVTNGMHRESHNVDLMARMVRAESRAQKIQIEKASPVLAENNLAFRNQGGLQFAECGAAWGLDEKGVSFGAAFGDLDGDGDLDLVYANYQKSVSVLRNDTQGGHRVIFDLRGTQSNRFGVGATVRIETVSGSQVRQLVLARGVLSNSEPCLHFGLGQDSELKRVTVVWPSGVIQVLESLPADQRYTVHEPSTPKAAALPPPHLSPAVETARTAAAAVAVSAGASGSAVRPLYAEISRAPEINLSLVAREAKLDELSQQPLLPLRQNRRGPFLAVGDLDGDGRADFALGGTTLDPLRLGLAKASGFEVSPLAGVGLAAADDGPLALFDADGDGDSDLLVTRGGVALPPGAPEFQPLLYLNDGHARFTAAPVGVVPELRVSAGAAAVGDVNNDGRPDVFIGGRVVPGQYPQTPPSALWLNRGGRFEDATDAFAPELRTVGLVTAALWVDLDADGWRDLVLALEWGQIKCFHNDNGQRLTDATERMGFAAAGTGWWSALAADDLNCDGRPDVVAGNLGLNTPYRADAAHPVVLYTGDFKGDGSEQLVEAYYEGDRLLPRRARRDLGAALPALLKRYPRNDAYAAATLPEIFGEERLSSAQRFTATELRSGVFLSQPDGRYRFEALPRLAQLSQIQSVAIRDFDSDGILDVYVVQNSYSPVPYTGRFDGGLSQLLRGDGRGNLVPLSPQESGLIVPGPATSIAVLPATPTTILVAQNNAPLLIFRRTAL